MFPSPSLDAIRSMLREPSFQAVRETTLTLRHSIPQTGGTKLSQFRGSAELLQTQEASGLQMLKRSDPSTSTREGTLDSQASNSSLFSNKSDPVTDHTFNETITALEQGVERWIHSEYIGERLMQHASSNHGQVISVKHKPDERMLAVKRMPLLWMQTSHVTFKQKNTMALEQPWRDVAMVKILNELKFPYACHLHGLFRDDEYMYMSTSLATDGDLYSVCESGPQPGSAREGWISPVVIQICSAVRHLHDLNIAHLDLSLENILADRHDTELRIKLIDYGMAQVSRFCQPAKFGKTVYRAPELMGKDTVDSFKGDSFSLGVIVYILASQDYPWKSTCASDACPLFKYFAARGMGPYVARRKVRKNNDKTIASVMSLLLFNLLSGLLELNPSKRTSLGENCFVSGQFETSVWDFPWLNLPVLGGAVANV